MKSSHIFCMSLLPILLVTSYATMQGVCPIYTPVNPIAGENIWQIASRTGNALDDLAYTSSLCCPSTCFITQADVPGLVIRESGIYSAAENITIGDAGGTNVIDVQADDVVIDFRGYTLTSGSNTTALINVNGRTNVVIKNGFFNTTSGTAALNISSGSNIQLINCCVSNTAGQGILIDSIDELVVDSCIAHDCLGLGNGFEGFIFLTVTNGVVRNCQSIRTGIGFELESGCSSIVFNNCVASENFAIGYQDDPSCSSLLFTYCDALNNDQDGFIIDGTDGRLLNCSALNNGTNGFVISLGITGRVALISSIAVNNGGFGITNAQTNSYIFNNISAGNAGGNYSGVTAGTLITSAAVTTTTGYWSNING